MKSICEVLIALFSEQNKNKAISPFSQRSSQPDSIEKIPYT